MWFHVICRDNLAYFFPMLVCFISFSCLSALAQTLILLYVNRNGKTGNPFCFLVLAETLYTFYQAKSLWYMAYFLSFYHERILNFVKCFFFMYLYDYVISLLHCYCAESFIGLQMLNYLCFLRINPFGQVNDQFSVLLN